MTAITLHVDDSLAGRLKEKAKDQGVNIDIYILAQLNKMVPQEMDENKIDKFLESMQLSGQQVPSDETGKGALAGSQYLGWKSVPTSSSLS